MLNSVLLILTLHSLPADCPATEAKLAPLVKLAAGTGLPVVPVTDGSRCEAVIERAQTALELDDVVIGVWALGGGEIAVQVESPATRRRLRLVVVSEASTAPTTRSLAVY